VFHSEEAHIANDESKTGPADATRIKVSEPNEVTC
jgi:hypothetical protein